MCRGSSKKQKKSWWLYKWYLVMAHGRRKNNNDGPEGRHGNEGNSIQIQETDDAETAHLNTRSKMSTDQGFGLECSLNRYWEGDVHRAR